MAEIVPDTAPTAAESYLANPLPERLAARLLGAFVTQQLIQLAFSALMFASLSLSGLAADSAKAQTADKAVEAPPQLSSTNQHLAAFNKGFQVG